MNTAFPLLIDIVGKNHVMVVASPLDIPTGIDFIVLEINCLG